MAMQQRTNETRKKNKQHQCMVHNDREWGDEISITEGWEVGENENRFRIVNVNINGIAAIYNWIEWDIMIRNMAEIQADAIGVTEPNINFTNKEKVSA